MDDEPAGPGGAADAFLVLRVWHEGGPPGAFRARVLTGPEGSGTTRTAVASSPEQALEVVRAWLEELTG